MRTHCCSADYANRIDLPQKEVVLDQVRRVLADENFGSVYFVEPLETGAEVHLISQDAVGETIAGAQIADEHGARVDARPCR